MVRLDTVECAVDFWSDRSVDLEVEDVAFEARGSVEAGEDVCVRELDLVCLSSALDVIGFGGDLGCYVVDVRHIRNGCYVGWVVSCSIDATLLLERVLARESYLLCVVSTLSCSDYILVRSFSTCSKYTREDTFGYYPYEPLVQLLIYSPLQLSALHIPQHNWGPAQAY